MADIQKQMAERVAAISSQVGSAGPPRIKINKDKTFTLPTGETSDQLSVVILAWRTHHLYYDKKYQEGEVNPPVCFAVGPDPKNMTPSPNAPKKQADKCNVNNKSVCPFDVFGSDGRGKLCQNRRVLAVLAPDANQETEILTLSVSPTGLRRFDAYVESVKAAFKAIPISVITQIGFLDNAQYTTLTFSKPVPNPNMKAMWPRLDEAEHLVSIEPIGG